MNALINFDNWGVMLKLRKSYKMLIKKQKEKEKTLKIDFATRVPRFDVLHHIYTNQWIWHLIFDQGW